MVLLTWKKWYQLDNPIWDCSPFSFMWKPGANRDSFVMMNVYKTFQWQTQPIFFGLWHSSYWNKCKTLYCVTLHTWNGIHSVYIGHIFYFSFPLLWFSLIEMDKTAGRLSLNCNTTAVWEQILFLKISMYNYACNSPVCAALITAKCYILKTRAVRQRSYAASVPPQRLHSCFTCISIRSEHIWNTETENM